MILRKLHVEQDWPYMVAGGAAPVLCQDTQGIVAEDARGIAGIVVMDSWSHNSVQVHMAIFRPACLRHGLLEACSHHIHVTGGRNIIIGLVPGDNEKALKLNRHLGYTEVHRIKNGHAVGVDTVIMELRAENNRWLKRWNDGREKQQRAA